MNIFLRGMLCVSACMAFIVTVYGGDITIKMKSNDQAVSSTSAGAQSRPSGSEPTAARTAYPQSSDMNALREKTLREQQGRENAMLEDMKKKNPQAYEQYIAAKKARDQKNAIIENYRLQKITEAQAKAQLAPLVEKEINIDMFLKNVDENISRLEAEIKRLKSQKANPRELIDEAVNRYLGIRTAS